MEMENVEGLKTTTWDMYRKQHSQHEYTYGCTKCNGNRWGSDTMVDIEHGVETPHPMASFAPAVAYASRMLLALESES